MALMSNRSRYAQTAAEDSTPDTVDNPVGEHTHEQPRSVLVIVLTVAVVLLSSTVGWLLYNSYTTQRDLAEVTAYIEGRGAQRDAENDRLNRRIDGAVCDVLDQLPAGGLFDPIRAQYGCGPGIPVDELDPQAAQNLADILGELEDAQPTVATPDPSVPTSAPDELPPGAPPGAQPSPMGQAPTPTAAPTSAPQPTAAPTTTTPPLVDLTPLTDPACALLGVCIGPN